MHQATFCAVLDNATPHTPNSWTHHAPYRPPAAAAAAAVDMPQVLEEGLKVGVEVLSDDDEVDEEGEEEGSEGEDD